MKRQYDIGLVGAGPLGIEMAVALKRAGLDYVHLEALQIGATMAWWAPGTRWFSSNERISIAGVPMVTTAQEKASREEYLAYLRGVVEQFGLNIHTYHRVEQIRRAADRILLTVRHSLHGDAGATEVSVSKLILATGGTARPNLIGIPGEALPHVSHYFEEPHRYYRQRVVIVGGKNSAVEAALRCHRAGAKVSFSYRREQVSKESIKYWLYPEFSAFCKTGEISAHWNTIPLRITRDAVELRAADGSIVTVPADFVLLLTGYVADMSLAKMAGVTVTGEQEIPTFDHDTMQTNAPGVYIAGTAVAGTQRGYKVFLENCHVHVERIISHITGKRASAPDPRIDRPES